MLAYSIQTLTKSFGQDITRKMLKKSNIWSNSKIRHISTWNGFLERSFWAQRLGKISLIDLNGISKQKNVSLCYRKALTKYWIISTHRTLRLIELYTQLRSSQLFTQNKLQKSKENGLSNAWRLLRFYSTSPKSRSTMVIILLFNPLNNPITIFRYLLLRASWRTARWCSELLLVDCEANGFWHHSKSSLFEYLQKAIGFLEWCWIGL